MFNRILVPLDGSPLAETVLPHVRAIARVNGSEVIFLRVLDPTEQAGHVPSVDALDWQIQKAEAGTYLERLASRFSEAGLQSRTEIMEGRAAERIVECSQINEINLIILSSHGQSGITGWNVSSVVQKVILRARTSIMIVRAYKPLKAETEELRYRRILIPLDGSQRAESILPKAIALARVQGAEVLVAHVVEQPEMPRRTPLTKEDIELAECITERNRAEAEKYLAELKARLDVNVETRLIISQSAMVALHELVEQEGIDLLLAAAHGYTGETKWPYGSVVISFIAYGNTPLLIFQDLPKERIQPTQAEEAAKERGGH